MLSVSRRCDSLAREPAYPVRGPASIVRDRENLHPLQELDVDNVVGESANEDPTDVFVVNARRPRPDPRVLFDPGHRSINRCEKLPAESDPMLLVPAHGFRHFGVRLLADPKRQLQRLLSPFRIRSRTSGHGLPGSSPERARAARRSISAAHAASASSSGAPSKLASNSATSSARSGRPSFRASSSSLSPTLLTETRLPRGAPSNKPYLQRARYARR